MLERRDSARHETKSRNPLPKMLPGVVCVQWRKCGKPTCRCSRGALHGPYHYRFWRVGGRLQKEYVRASELKQVREACARWRSERLKLRLIRRLGWETWRALQEFVRQAEDQSERNEAAPGEAD